MKTAPPKPTSTPSAPVPFEGDERWQALDTPAGDTFTWDADSTYLRRPPYLDGMNLHPDPVADIEAARVLVKLGDSVTTDHVSPAGAISVHTPRASTSPPWVWRDFS